MEPNSKASVSVRLTPKCRDSVQLVTKNSSTSKQIRLINRNSNDFVLYEFDQIYEKDTTNQCLYESLIFTEDLDTVHQVDSSLFCFLGSQGVGKTYTVTGELPNVWENSGLLVFLMQDLLNKPLKIPSQAKLAYSQSHSNAVELRFLQVLGENVENIGFQTVYGESTNERQLANRIDYKIDIKSLAHFQNCINKIYERKKPHMHLIIEVTLKNQPMIYTTKKTILTFIQVSSACFDDVNVHSQKIKSEVDALITIFQNFQRIKHLEHLFESSKLTKLLKNNFFQSKKINLVGILDNSFKGNSMTLKWLKMSQQFKEDKTLIQSMKEDIKKEEEYLKSLMEKHKKAMTLLSKCIGTELSFLQKQKNFVNSKRQIDFAFGNSFNKRCEKIKVANLKKQLNEEEIEKLNKQISVIEEQLDFLECEHKESIKKLQEERNETITAKNKLVIKLEQAAQQALYKNIFSSNGSSLNNGSSIFWKPTLQFENANLNHTDKKGDKDYDLTSKKDLTSRNSENKISSNKISCLVNCIVNPPKSNMVIAPSIAKIQRKKVNHNESYDNPQESLLLEMRREQSVIKQETKREVYDLFRIISEQEAQLEESMVNYPENISIHLMNRIKNRQNQTVSKLLKQRITGYLKEGKDFSLEKYQEFVQNQEIFLTISREINSKDRKSQMTIATNIL